MAQLLERGSFAEVTVADILSAAGVSRGSFYFYFDSKHDVLAELVRRAVARGHDAAEPWLAEGSSSVRQQALPDFDRAIEDVRCC